MTAFLIDEMFPPPVATILRDTCHHDAVLVFAPKKNQEVVAPWPRGEQTVRFLIDRGRLESIAASDLTASAEAPVSRATLRLNATAVPALEN